jgi:hypothetical protein
MDLKDTESGDVNWIHLAQDMVQWQAHDMVINLQVPQKVGQFLLS